MLKKIVISIIFLTGSFTLYAQGKLTLEDAIAKGLANNYGLSISILQSEIAAENNTWGAVGAYPTITGTAQYNFSKEVIETPKTEISTLGASVDASWTLFNGFRIRTSKRISGYKYDLAKGSEAVQIENCITDVVLNFYSVILQKELLNFNKVLYTLSKDRFERDKQIAEIGGKGTYELIQSESAYLADYQTYLSQERIVKAAMYNLNLAMGVDVNYQWNISDKINVPSSEYTVAGLFDMMFGNNVTLKNQYINQKTIEENIELAKGDRLPKIDLKAGGRYNLYTSDNSNSVVPYAGITLTTTIFAGNTKQRNIAIANLQNKIGNVTIEQMKLELSNRLMSEYDNYEYSRRLLSLAQREMEVAQINLTLSGEKYNNGAISSFDYRAVQLTYQRAAINNLQITYAVLKANTELARLIGTFVK